MSTTRVGDNLIQVTRMRFVNAFLVREDDGFTLDSAKKLRELEPAVLVVGHGGPVRDPGRALDKAIASAGG